MSEFKLKVSNRIKKIVEQILPNQDLWDLCCDHGYVGKLYLTQNPTSKVYFVDQVSEIIKSLKDSKDFEQHNVDFKCCDIMDLVNELTGTVVLTGVGQYKISSFLQKLVYSDHKIVRLIVGPQQPLDFETQYSQILNAKFLFKDKIVLTEKRRTRLLYVYDCLPDRF